MCPFPRLLLFVTLLFSQESSKYSWMNRSNEAISSSAFLLISGLATHPESVLRLLELLDLRELAVDWLPWLESVLLEPREREEACGEEDDSDVQDITCLGRVL